MMAVDVKILSRNGHPKAVLLFDLRIPASYYCYTSMRNKIKRFKADGFNAIEMPVSYLEDFIRINERLCGKPDDIRFTDDSLPVFYGYYRGEQLVCSARLTEKYVQTWVNYDCPDLIRFTVNIKRETNWAGSNLLFFEDILYQDDGYGVSVDELTEIEYNAFKKAMNPDWYCWEKIEQAYKNQNSTENLDLVEKQVEEYEKQVQELINLYQTELEKEKAFLPEHFLDCGFMMIYTNNKDINDKISLLKAKGNRTVVYLKLDFPEDYQSVTNSAILFKHFKDIANCPLTDELYVRTMLD